MPAVETAPTATATQTRAAGSRMIGYYMDGPVKVDCLFDTGNFLTKNGNTFEGLRASDGDVLDIGKSGGQRLRVFANADTIGLFNAAGAGAGRDGLRILDGGVAFDINAVEAARATSYGFGIGLGAWEPAISLMVYKGSDTRIGLSDGTTTWSLAAGWAGAGTISFLQEGVGSKLTVTSGGVVRPGGDNSQPLGEAPNRWSDIHLVNSPTVTSDAREKTWRGAPTTAELAAAKRIIAELGFFQWNDAVAEKGADGARLHFGVRAQAVWAIMADEGLIDPLAEGEAPTSSYAFLCWDKWDAVEPVEEQCDEEGNITVAAVEDRPAGNRFGIRPDQLTLFLIAAQEARIAALEAA
jgi:hypothetical protein